MKIRYLTLTEQDIIQSALRKSVRLINKATKAKKESVEMTFEETAAYYRDKYSRMSVSEVLADYMERTAPMRITHSYRIKEVGKRIHLHLLDENGCTFALLDLTRNEWSQLDRCKAPVRGPMTYAMDSATSARGN